LVNQPKNILQNMVTKMDYRYCSCEKIRRCSLYAFDINIIMYSKCYIILIRFKNVVDHCDKMANYCAHMHHDGIYNYDREI